MQNNQGQSHHNFCVSKKELINVYKFIKFEIHVHIINGIQEIKLNAFHFVFNEMQNQGQGHQSLCQSEVLSQLHT